MGKIKLLKPIVIIKPICAILPANATKEQIDDYNNKLNILRKRYPKKFENEE
jgi:hypothetical protein